MSQSHQISFINSEKRERKKNRLPRPHFFRFSFHAHKAHSLSVTRSLSLHAIPRARDTATKTKNRYFLSSHINDDVVDHRECEISIFFLPVANMRCNVTTACGHFIHIIWLRCCVSFFSSPLNSENFLRRCRVGVDKWVKPCCMHYWLFLMVVQQSHLAINSISSFVRRATGQGLASPDLFRPTIRMRYPWSHGM